MIELTVAESELVSTLELPRELRERLEAPGGATLDGDDVDVLVDLATDRLMERGFDAEYRPTSEGTALERLVDRLVAVDAVDPAGSHEG